MPRRLTPQIIWLGLPCWPYLLCTWSVGWRRERLWCFLPSPSQFGPSSLGAAGILEAPKARILTWPYTTWWCKWPAARLLLPHLRQWAVTDRGTVWRALLTALGGGRDRGGLRTCRLLGANMILVSTYRENKARYKLFYPRNILLPFLSLMEPIVNLSRAGILRQTEVYKDLKHNYSS